MSAYTPGPWRSKGFSQRNYFVMTKSGHVVAEVPRDRNYKPAAEANARLIAAAPELLKALRDLLHAFPGDYTEPPQHIVRARAAIAKATEAT